MTTEKRLNIVWMNIPFDSYALMGAMQNQIADKDFIDEVAGYLFEKEHSDAVIAAFRKYYTENDLPFPEAPSAKEGEV